MTRLWTAERIRTLLRAVIISVFGAFALVLSLTSTSPAAFANEYALAGRLSADIVGHGPTAVADAARDGDRQVVRDLLRSGSDVNAAHGDGFTALHWAAWHDDADMLRMLGVAGAHLEARTRVGGHTALLVASELGYETAVAALLEAGALVDGSSYGGTTPLMLAAGAGSVAAVDALLQAGASPWSVENTHGQAAIHFAAARGRTEVVRRLVDAGAETCATTAIYDAAASERRDREARIKRARTARALAELEAPAGDGPAAGAAPSEDDEDATPRRAASSGPETKSGKEGPRGKDNKASKLDEATSGLVAADPDLKKKDKSGFRWPWRKEKVAAVDPPKPLSYGQLVGRTGGLTALHYAARQGHLDTALALLDLGADIDFQADGDRSTPLLIATINGHFDLAQRLLERGANPNRVSDAGAAPLFAAINVQWAPHAFYPQPTQQYQQQTNYLQLMTALLDHGAEVDARLTKKVWYTGYNFDQSGVDETGATAFWRAAQAADVEAMRLLVAGGADWTLPTVVVPERRSPNGRNAGKDLARDAPKIGEPAVSPFLVASGAGYVGNFHRISPGGFLRAARYFVEELDAPINQADAKGFTAMHNAAMRGDNSLLIYYLWHGADPHAVSREGDNVADMANGPVQRIQPFPETLALLKAFGVQHNDRCVSC